VLIYVTDAADLKLCLVLHLFRWRKLESGTKKADRWVREKTDVLESESAACQTAAAAAND